jgi:hypothetical protein
VTATAIQAIQRDNDLHRAKTFLTHPERGLQIVREHVSEGRFERTLSLVAGVASLISGLEVSYEHYKGSYGQRIMYTPVIFSGALFAAGIWAASGGVAARKTLRAVSALTLADCLVGFAFHIRGIHRKPGGWRLPVTNIVMGPPIFAPLLFGTSAYLGLIASFLQEESSKPLNEAALKLQRTIAKKHFSIAEILPRNARNEITAEKQNIRHGRFRHHMAIITAASAVFSGFEAWYSHYKNNFRYAAQWTPIILAPALAVISILAIKCERVAKRALPAVSVAAAADAAVGFFYHARGVARRPGGRKHLVYNILYGPPIFAPLLFGAAGMFGLLTSMLRKAKR